MSSKCTNPLAQSGPGYEDGHGLYHVETCQQNLACRVTGRAFGGSLQPGLWKPYEHRKLANPVPLGLCGFATSCFVLSCINLQARGVEAPNIAVPLALVYGGFCQVLAGMWAVAVGNTFGATALTSYGAFWLSYGFLLTPAWSITDTANGPYAADPTTLDSAIGLYLTGWFILTTVLLLCTLRSTVAFVFLFVTLDLCYLFLACQSYAKSEGNFVMAGRLQVAGGVFGILAAFAAYYNALAGLVDSSNSFFTVPVIHLPWSDEAMQNKKERTRESGGRHEVENGNADY